MTYDTKDNVRPIRSDIYIDTDDKSKLTPNQELVNALKELTDLAEKGVLQEFHGIIGFYDSGIELLSIGTNIHEYMIIGGLYKLLSSISNPTVMLLGDNE